MKRTVNEYEFIMIMKEFRPDNFTDEGLKALFDYLEEWEEDCGEETELDPIGLCCEFCELTLDIINYNYYGNFKTLEEAVEYLKERTTVIPVAADRVIVQKY